MAPARPGRQGAPLASLHTKGALDLQGLCRGRIQLLYIYFIACTVTLGGELRRWTTPPHLPAIWLAWISFLTPSCPACPIDMAYVLLSSPQCTICPVNFFSHWAPLTPGASALGADHAMQRVSSDAALLLWREIRERWNLPAPRPACPAHAHACPLSRPPESVWAQPALDQLNGSSPVLQFLHVVVFLFLLLGGF